MPYLNCPRCHLTILDRRLHPSGGECPRCLGVAGVRVPLFASTLTYRELTHAGSAAADGNHGQPA